MIQFPKIGQFRDVIKNVSHRAMYRGKDEEGNVLMDRSAKKPTLKFRGTVKMHGTNASVVLDKKSNIVAQSRNRVLSIDSDNAGFAFFVDVTGRGVWEELIQNLMIDCWPENNNDFSGKDWVLYGEWCGGNIQKGVALSNLEKMFVVYGLRCVEDKEKSVWVDIKSYGNLNLDEKKIYSIYDERFPHWEVDIDFENAALFQNKLIEITDSVEKECPVAKAFGSSGIGEGVVWTCVEPGYLSSDYWFKVKGKEHSVSKVKTLASVDVEKMNSVSEFVDRVATVNRFKQGIDYLKEYNLEISRKYTGEYIKWVVNDCVLEEKEILAASGLEPKDVSKDIGTRAREWFFNQIDNGLI